MIYPTKQMFQGPTVHYIISTSSDPICVQPKAECHKTDEPMEPNLPPSAPPHYGAPPNPNQVHYQIPAYEYAHAQHPDGTQPPYQTQYYITGYNAGEYVVPDTHYVVEQPPANYYPNGYVQPSTSNGPHPTHIAYPPHAHPAGVVYSNSYDARSQPPPGQRHFVDQKGYIMNRFVNIDVFYKFFIV